MGSIPFPTSATSFTVSSWVNLSVDSTTHARLVTERDADRVRASYLQRLSAKQLGRRQHAADLAIAEMGVTFTVYSEGTNIS